MDTYLSFPHTVPSGSLLELAKELSRMVHHGIQSNYRKKTFHNEKTFQKTSFHNKFSQGTGHSEQRMNS